MLNENLLKILVCPDTKQPVHPAEAQIVEKINAAISQGALRNIKGDRVSEPVETALVRKDGRIAYPVRGGIPVMLVEEGFQLP